MISKLSPGRLVAAAVAAIALVLLAPGAGLSISTVSADVAGISAGDTTVVDNQQVSISVQAEDDDGTLTISTSDGDDILTFDSCAGAGSCSNAVVSGSGTSSVSINTDAATIDADTTEDALNVSLTLRVDCDSSSESVQVAATQGVTRSVTVHCNNQADTDITIRKEANSSASFRFVFDVSGGTCVVFKGGAAVESGSGGDFSLSDNQTAQFDCTNDAIVTVTEDVDGDLVHVSGCVNEAGVTEGTRSVRIDTAQSDSVSCTFNNTGAANPASIQLSASNLTPQCGTQSTISAYVIDSDGTVANNGTVVTFSASAGTLSSATASTNNGIASVVYTAPANFQNLVTITASMGSASSQGQIRVVCVGTTPVTQQPPAQPTPQPTPRPVTPVTAPSAGDGGLLSADSFSWTLFAGILLAAAISMGAAFILQKDKDE